MPAPRTWTDEDLAREAPRSNTMSELLNNLGLNFGGDQYPRIRDHCVRLGIDISHFRRGGSSLAISDEDWVKANLVKSNKKISGERLKKRLVGAGVFEDKCYSCGISEWCGVKAPIQVNHINGDPRDHRLENLELLCANCHCLTPTWGRKARTQ